MKYHNCLFILCFFVSIPFISAQYFNFEHNGLNREYWLYIPDSFEPDAPLVFALHGYTGNALGLKNYIGMDEIAEEFGFVVCYPNGTVDDFGNRYFNVGYAFHEDETVDDMGFISELAVYLQETHSLSTEYTFSTGMSNGGDMSYRLACQLPEQFRAIAPVAGTMMLNVQENCQSEGMPVMEIHGTNDDVTYYEGDLANADGWGAYLPIADVIDFWVEMNACTFNSTENLADLDTSDGSQVQRTIYSGGIDDSEVWLYKVEDGGHDWPGAWGNMDINSSFEIWYFFSQFLDGPSNNSQIQYTAKAELRPNPSAGVVYISGASAEEAIPYRLYNAKGTLQEIGTSSGARINLKNDYNSGMYFLFLGNRAYAKLLIEN